ncbi:hypothetical protein PTI98_008361 [Pleurotus ostreatus]|nr:hypothetical protein PTI98_008361 [Pleurotus ostreatus]
MQFSKSLAFLVATLATSLTVARTANPPGNWGVLLFPNFAALDVFGPIEALNLLSETVPLNLSLIAKTLDPVPTQPHVLGEVSNFTQSVDLRDEIAFIRDTYPRLKYLIAVCTGAWLAADSGVLDGHNATTNKAAWAERPVNNTVNWIAHARWVVDGNIWTSSGISAGIDAALAFVGEIYGEGLATDIANAMEYERNTDPTRDPFADLYGL